MKATSTFVKKIASWEYTPFVFLFLVMFLLHLYLPINLLDDRHYRRMTELSRLVPYLENIYGEWSSRLLIITAIRGMLGTFPAIVWRILNPAVFAALGLIISRLVCRKPSSALNWFIVIMLFIFPFIDLRSAGWVTTSLNYLWVAAAGLFAVLVAKKILSSERVQPLEPIAAIPLLLYGANQEQMAAVLTLVFMVMTALMLRQKRFHWFIPASLLLSIASALFSLLSPGNAARRLVEMRDFIDFDALSLVDKLEIGYSSTLERLVFRPNLLFFTLVLVLTIGVVQQHQAVFTRLYALFALFGILYSGVFTWLGASQFPFLHQVQSQLTDKGFITLQNFTQAGSYVPFILGSVLLVMVFSLLVSSFEHRSSGLLAAGILLLGILSRVMLGFSPSIWDSSSRTMMFLYTAIILCGALVFDDKYHKRCYSLAPILMTAGFIAVISFLNLLTAVFTP